MTFREKSKVCWFTFVTLGTAWTWETSRSLFSRETWTSGGSVSSVAAVQTRPAGQSRRTHASRDAGYTGETRHASPPPVSLRPSRPFGPRLALVSLGALLTLRTRESLLAFWTRLPCQSRRTPVSLLGEALRGASCPVSFRRLDPAGGYQVIAATRPHRGARSGVGVPLLFIPPRVIVARPPVVQAHSRSRVIIRLIPLRAARGEQQPRE